MTNRWLFAAGGAFFGFLLFTVASQLGALELEGGLTFGNILQASTTVVVGFVVSHYLQRQTASDRRQRELVLRHIDHALDTLDKLEASGRRIQLTELNAAFKKIKTDIIATRDLMKELGYDDALQKHMGTDHLVQEIRRLATETPKVAETPAANDNTPVSISDGIVLWSEDRVAIIDTKIHQLRLRLLRCQIAINRG
jgi:hypothetical protein